MNWRVFERAAIAPRSGSRSQSIYRSLCVELLIGGQFATQSQGWSGVWFEHGYRREGGHKASGDLQHHGSGLNLGRETNPHKQVARIQRLGANHANSSVLDRYGYNAIQIAREAQHEIRRGAPGYRLDPVDRNGNDLCVECGGENNEENYKASQARKLVAGFYVHSVESKDEERSRSASSSF